jgi:hypothetical protein
MSEQETFEEVFEKIYGEAWDIMMQRQRRYGPENIRKQGLHGVTTRIGEDKLSRIKNTLRGRVVAGEVVLEEMSPEDLAVAEDAFFDIANYALICVSLLRNRWGFPMAGEISKAEGKDE